jgi:sugar O-acyltransferase (sialic acid O-acetyltransferase NeuD family)
MRKLIIIGAGGHGKVVVDIAVKINKWQSISFLDDDSSVLNCMGFPVVGKVREADLFGKEADFIVAIGDYKDRKRILEELIEKGLSVVSLVHPDAVIGLNVEIGTGTVVMAGAVINSCSRIGKGSIINTCSSIDHDCEIGDYVHISPGANIAGGVKIGEKSWAGMGSSVINNLRVCADCIIGAGAVVVRNIEEPGVYVGVPSKKIK